MMCRALDGELRIDLHHAAFYENDKTRRKRDR
jgi:hypothetical protein